jgi:hypothetical protein
MENQGRSKRQVENNYKILDWTFCIFIGFVVIALTSKAISLW